MRWRATYTVRTEAGAGAFSVVLEIADGENEWLIAEAIFTNCNLLDMEALPDGD